MVYTYILFSKFNHEMLNPLVDRLSNFLFLFVVLESAACVLSFVRFIFDARVSGVPPLGRIESRKLGEWGRRRGGGYVVYVNQPHIHNMPGKK
jgi:hypothetical protein